MSGQRHNGEGSIYQTATGYRAYVWVTTPQGLRRRKYVSGKNRDDVHERWLRLHQAAARGPVAQRVPSLQAYLLRWLVEVIEPTLARHTFIAYETCVRLYIVPGLGSRRLDRLTVSDVRQWVNRMRSRCQCCAQGKDAARQVPRCCAAGQCCNQAASESTIHQAWRVLRAALASAERDELVSRNVASLVRMPVPRTKAADVWSVGEARQFLESAKADADPLYVAYTLLLLLGLRRGETLGLAWEDVDLVQQEATVRWQLQRVGGTFTRSRVKTRSSDAILPLPPTCLDALKAHREFQQRQINDRGSAWHDSGLVVTSGVGTPMDPRNFHRQFKARAAVAGVPVIPVHSTRRTCASLLVDLGVHPRVAMQILRHSKIALTMEIYAQVSSSSARDALARLDESMWADQK